MSYCRWSCLNGYSDVYVYEDSQGWTTHVASMREPPGAPKSAAAAMFEHFDVHGDDPEGATNAYRLAGKARGAWSERNPPFKIKHPEAGESFRHDSPGDCADNLERLASEGFTVPDWAIAALREEQSEVDK